MVWGRSRSTPAPSGPGSGRGGAHLSGDVGGDVGRGEPGAGAWEAAFREHYPALVGHLTRLLGDRAAAEDVAQEAFLRLMRSSPAPRDGFGPWLHVVATRLAYNLLRGERRRQAREEAFGRQPQPAPEAGEAEALRPEDAGATAEAVRAALETLSPRDRLALQLRAEGAPYAEIAAAIGVGAGSVGTVLARAARRLRQACADADPGATGASAPRGSAATTRLPTPQQQKG